MGGVVYTADEVEELSAEHPDLATHTVSMWDGFYLGPLRPGDPPDAAELINHSCDASAGVRGQVVIVARRGIASGDEITLDYDTTETAATGGFACRCGSPHCRAVIDGTGWRRDEFRIRYAGFLSWYIAERIGRELGRPTEPSARHPVAP